MKKVFALIAAAMITFGAMAQSNTSNTVTAQKGKVECCKAKNGCATGEKECKKNCANPACTHNQGAAVAGKACCKNDAAKVAEAKACCKKDAAKSCCKKDAAKVEKKGCCKK